MTKVNILATDEAGNTLLVTNGQISVTNREGKLVNKKDTKTFLRRKFGKEAIKKEFGKVRFKFV